MIPTSLPLDYSPLYLHLGSIHIHAGCCSKLTEDHYNSSYRMSRLLLCLYVYALDFPRFGFSVSISVLLSSPSSPSFPFYAPKIFLFSPLTRLATVLQIGFMVGSRLRYTCSLPECTYMLVIRLQHIIIVSLFRRILQFVKKGGGKGTLGGVSQLTHQVPS